MCCRYYCEHYCCQTTSSDLHEENKLKTYIFRCHIDYAAHTIGKPGLFLLLEEYSFDGVLPLNKRGSWTQAIRSQSHATFWFECLKHTNNHHLREKCDRYRPYLLQQLIQNNSFLVFCRLKFTQRIWIPQVWPRNCILACKITSSSTAWSYLIIIGKFILEQMTFLRWS